MSEESGPVGGTLQNLTTLRETKHSDSVPIYRMHSDMAFLPGWQSSHSLSGRASPTSKLAKNKSIRDGNPTLVSTIARDGARRSTLINKVASDSTATTTAAVAVTENGSTIGTNYHSMGIPLSSRDNFAATIRQRSSDSTCKLRANVRLSPLESIKSTPSQLLHLEPLPSTDSNPTQAPANPTQLTMESIVSDFKQFQEAMQHPCMLLGIIPSENDNEVHNELDSLCNELLTTLAELETSLEDITSWKDDFLKQSVPSHIKLELTILFARLFRSKSDLHEPFFELIKSVRLYSRPWMEKRNALYKLQEEYQRNHEVVDIAIRKLENMDLQLHKIKASNRVNLWERLMTKVMMFQKSTPSSLTNAAGSNISNNANKYLPVAEPTSDWPRININQSPLSGGTLLAPHQSTIPTDCFSSTHTNDFAFLKLQENIRMYIVDEPDWLQNSRIQLKRFKAHLKTNFPGIRKIWPHILRRPLPIPGPSINYISTKTGTIIMNKRHFPRSRAYSCQDFKEIKEYSHKVNENRSATTVTEKDHSNQLVVFSGHPQKNSNTTNKEVDRRIRVPRTLAYLRSNSFNTLHDLGESPQLYRPLVNNHKVHTVDRSDMCLNNESDFDSVDTASETVSESDNYSDLDSKYFQRFREEDIQDVVSKFMDSHQIRPKSIGSNDENGVEDPFQNMDTKKEFFSMQEMIELTLLHAQQMHIMQTEYNDRFNHLSDQLDQAHIDQAELDVEWERKYAQMQDRAQKRVSQTTSQQCSDSSSSEKDDSDHRNNSVHNQSLDPLENLHDNSRLINDVHTQKYHLGHEGVEDPSHLRLEKLRERTERRRIETIKKRAHFKKPVKRELPPWRPPKFTSTPMAMSFMERLRWFTEISLRKRTESRINATRLEMIANEQKLEHLQRNTLVDVEETQSNMIESSGIMAEFMPMPGKVPVSKPSRDRLTGQGTALPWGGRFKTHFLQQPAANRINVLNLFDVAMNIPSVHPKKYDNNEG
ncbi:hypothetical protein BASA61_005937 [Batrachochytrium salamandrivorans]|nr:hypothetical protein BASA61_005937 [Batrachochytrium salamandrivorans]